MKRRVVYFLLCLCFCFYSLSLNFSAADGVSGLPGEPVYPLVDDLIEEGFVMDEAGDYVYYGENPPFNYNTFLISRKNFPDFDIKSLPWLSFPVYVKEILSLDTGSYMPLYIDDGSEEYHCFDKIPFILIRPYAADLVEIYAGYNVAIGSYNDEEVNLNIFASPNSFYNGSACYFARYDFDGNVVIDWKQLPLNTPFNNKNIGYYQTYAIGNLTRVSDYYFWGGNSIKPSSAGATSFSIFTVPGDSSSTQIQGYQSLNGFKSGNYWFFQNSFQNAYCTTFTPPSEEELNYETNKGIFETLKEVLENIKDLPWLETIWNAITGVYQAISELPNNIKGFFTSLGDRISGFFTKLVEDIKGLFIPDDGYFDTYQEEFQTYFRERFGLLYEISELVVNLLQKFVTFNPKDSDYSITFPEVPLPVLEDGEWREEVLIEENEFSFNFINEAPFKVLYDIYVAFIWLVYILLLVNLIKNKANRIFKGG